MLQPNHGDSPKMVNFIKNYRKLTYKSAGHYTKVSKHAFMYTNYNYKNEWVLIVHGLGGAARKMTPYVKNFLDLGYNTIIAGTRRNSEIDFINNWESDIEAILAKLKSKYGITPSVIYGQSLGASAVLSIASKNQYKFDKIIVDSPFDDFYTTARNMYPIVARVIKSILSKLNYPRDILNKVKTLETPVLYCYGSADQATTPEQVKNLINNTKNSQFIAVEHAGHCRAMFYNPKAYWQKIKKFLGD